MISLFLWLKTIVHKDEGGESVFSGIFGLFRFQTYELSGILGGIC